jgi:transposase
LSPAPNRGGEATISKNEPRPRDAAFKAKVALEALLDLATLPDLAAKYGVHPNQIYKWKRKLLYNAAAAFDAGPSHRDAARDAELADAYAKIGKLTVELDFLARRSGRRAARTA